MRPTEELLGIAEDLVRRARAKGADHAEAYVREARSVSITYKGDHAYPNEGHGVGVSVRAGVGKRVGIAGTSGLHRLDRVIDDAVRSARSSPERARFDGFAEPRPVTLPPSPVHADVDAAEPARVLAAARAGMESMAGAETTFRAFTARSGVSHFAVANDRGVAAWDRSGRESYLLEVRVSRTGRDVTTWDGGGGARPLEDAFDLGAVGARATRRAVDALDARPLERPVEEVVFAPGPGAQIVGRFVQGFAGGLVRGGHGPLGDPVDRAVASPLVHIVDSPHGDGTTPQRLRVDHEGVPTQTVPLVHEGVGRNLLWDTISAAGHGAASNGHGIRAGGWSSDVGSAAINPMMRSGTRPIEDLVADADRAVLVHDSMTGMFTTNVTTGDFSAVLPCAYYVERGEVRHALPNTTVGGNLLRIMTSVRAVGALPTEQLGGAYPPFHSGGVSCMT